MKSIAIVVANPVAVRPKTTRKVHRGAVDRPRHGLTIPRQTFRLPDPYRSVVVQPPRRITWIPVIALYSLSRRRLYASVSRPRGFLHQTLASNARQPPIDRRDLHRSCLQSAIARKAPYLLWRREPQASSRCRSRLSLRAPDRATNVSATPDRSTNTRSALFGDVMQSSSG